MKNPSAEYAQEAFVREQKVMVEGTTQTAFPCCDWHGSLVDVNWAASNALRYSLFQIALLHSFSSLVVATAHVMISSTGSHTVFAAGSLKLTIPKPLCLKAFFISPWWSFSGRKRKKKKKRCYLYHRCLHSSPNNSSGTKYWYRRIWNVGSWFRINALSQGSTLSLGQNINMITYRLGVCGTKIFIRHDRKAFIIYEMGTFGRLIISAVIVQYW